MGENGVNNGDLHFVVLQEGDTWVAQCLEHDLGAQARTLEGIHRRIALVLQCERRESIARYGAPFRGVDSSPRQFYAKWANRVGGYTRLYAIDATRTRVEIGFCSPGTNHCGILPTFGRYCAWVTSIGCGVRENICIARDGYVERVTRLSLHSVNRALEIGILDCERLAPMTIARLERRLQLDALANGRAIRHVLFSGSASA